MRSKLSYLYVLDDLGIKGVIVGVGWDFCCAILEQIFLPGAEKRKITPVLQLLKNERWIHNDTCNERPNSAYMLQLRVIGSPLLPF